MTLKHVLAQSDVQQNFAEKKKKGKIVRGNRGNYEVSN